MREETRVVNIPARKTVYIADDGKEFPTKSSCIDYENVVRRMNALGRIADLPHFGLYAPGAGNFDDDPTWTWYKISSEEDLDDIKVALYCNDASANEFETDVYPTWVLAVVDDMGYGWIETYDDYIEEVRSHIAELDARIEKYKVEK